MDGGRNWCHDKEQQELNRLGSLLLLTPIEQISLIDLRNIVVAMKLPLNPNDGSLPVPRLTIANVVQMEIHRRLTFVEERHSLTLEN